MSAMGIPGAVSVESERPLTGMQERWVEEYLKGGQQSAAEAARRAGYSERTAKNVGARWLRNERVMAEVRRRGYAISGASDLTVENVVDGLRGIAEDQNENGRARVAAYVQLGRFTGGFEPKKTIEMSGNVNITRGTPSLSADPADS